MLKAVIMAGGEGTRLRPITCSMPKPLVPLCGKPVLCYILELLRQHGCEGAVMTLLYLGHQIEAQFPEREYLGIPLGFCYEEHPLGTAGSVKNAMPSSAEPILVISGDAMCDFDLTAAMEYHRAKGAAATLVVKRVADPREYGLVSRAADGRIEGFLEKPPLSHCTTDLANTGVYILSPEVLERIPAGKNTDFASDLFPQMLAEELPLFAYEDEGYWCDIGDIRSYQQCQRDMLEGRVKCRIPAQEKNGIYSNTDLSGLHCVIEPPVFIGRGVTVGENSLIGSGSVIGDYATIGDNAKVRGGILQECSYVSDNAVCNQAILCKNARMLRGSAAYEQAVMGEDSTLGAESVLSGGARLWNKRETADGITVSGDVKYGAARNIVIDDDGISGETNRNITPELMVRLGAAVGSLKSGCTVGIASSRTGAGQSFRRALAGGITAAGANVLDFGEAFGAEYDFCLYKSEADFGIYIDSNIITNVMVSEKRGIPMMRGLERKLEGFLNRGEYKKAAWNSFGTMLDLSGLRQLYQSTLLQEAGSDLQGMSVQIKSADPLVGELLCDTLKKLGCGTRDTRLSLILSPDGRNLSVHTPETGYLFPEKVLCLVCLGEFLNGNDVAVPFETPLAVEQLAQRYGRQALRYYSSPCDETDAQARRMLAEHIPLRDGFVLAVRLLAFLKQRGMTVSEAARLLPEFGTASRLVGLHGGPAAVMKHFSSNGQSRGEGVSIIDGDSRILLRPMKSGRGIMLFAESLRSETATELCDFYEKKIHETEQQERRS